MSCQCIRIDAPDSLYVTDDFILTHNSSWAAGANKPIFLDIEKGLDAIEIPAIEIDSLSHLREALSYLRTEEHSFETVVLDSLDWIERAFHAQICVAANKKSIAEFSYGKGYAMALMYWKRLIDQLNSLRDKKNMQIIMLAHSQIKHFSDPNYDSYDRHSLKLHKSAQELMSEFADCIFFACHKVHVQKENKIFGKQIVKAKHTGQRVLYTESAASFLAKTRYKLPRELPLRYDVFQREFLNLKPTKEIDHGNIST